MALNEDQHAQDGASELELETAVLDGGELVDAGQDDIATLRERKRIQIASTLAYCIFGLLAGTGLLQYFLTACHASNPDALEALGHVFDAWLPVVSGFFGSAVTYYFTADRG